MRTIRTIDTRPSAGDTVQLVDGPPRIVNGVETYRMVSASVLFIMDVFGPDDAADTWAAAVEIREGLDAGQLRTVYPGELFQFVS